MSPDFPERAREVYIVGYSIPDEDTAFHSLVARVASRWDDRVTVHVWNPDPRVGERAERIFGRERVTLHEECAASFRFQ